MSSPILVVNPSNTPRSKYNIATDNIKSDQVVFYKAEIGEEHRQQKKEKTKPKKELYPGSSKSIIKKLKELDNIGEIEYPPYQQKQGCLYYPGIRLAVRSLWTE